MDDPNMHAYGEDGPDDAEIGRQWRENSSLEKWFPLTAERLAALEAEHAALERSRATYFAERNSARDAWRERVKRCEALEAALTLAVHAMRAPLDGWKGELERKALDAAHAALGPNMAMTPDGCSACGGTYFYISNHKCVACVSEAGRIKSEAKAATSLRGRNGLRQGFLLFDTVAHKILLYLDKNGPAGHAELLKGVGTIVATDIRKLVLADFIEVIGEERETGGRPYSVFDIVGRSEKMPPLKRQTKAQMIANYRKRRRARVASVFEFRGKIQINERKAA